MDQSLTMRDLPPDERPRERLIRYGSAQLSNAELIAILLRTGTAETSVAMLAEKILHQFHGLQGIDTAAIEELALVKGIGMAKATQIKAGLELGRRAAETPRRERFTFRSPTDVYQAVSSRLSHLDREVFMVFHLSAKNQVIFDEIISVGNLTSSLVHPRELFKSAIKKSAAAVILAHNHPSGDPTPSEDDLALTGRLVQAGELIGIRVLDHIIIGYGRYVSLKERGII